jgi:uncharacterized protein with HEPN domain
MDKGDLDRLRHIKKYCLDITNGIKKYGDAIETLLDDQLAFHGISMCIMQIGELIGGLSNSFKDSTRDRIQWGMARAMRNHFAHRYTHMNKNDILNTATKDIPELLNFCEDIIDNNKFNQLDF